VGVGMRLEGAVPCHKSGRRRPLSPTAADCRSRYLWCIQENMEALAMMNRFPVADEINFPTRSTYLKS